MDALGPDFIGGISMNRNKKEKVLLAIESFLPKKIALSTSKGEEADYEIFDAALLYSDISGFTIMSEKLSSMGKEGSEELNRIINEFFGVIIQIIYKWHGDIYRFEGDSILSFFPEEQGDLSPSLRALNAGMEIVNFVKGHKVIKTNIGSFKIKIHSSLVKGKVYFKDLKTDYFLGGTSLYNLIRINDFAGPGEIIVDEVVKEDLKDMSFTKVHNDLWKCEMKEISVQTPLKTKKSVFQRSIEERIEELRRYIPEWLYKKIQLKTSLDPRDGEHRRVSVVFLHFAGIPYEENPTKASSIINNFYRVVKQNIETYDGWLNKIDAYKDAARLMIVFGFPRAHEDDEKRATLCAYEILNNPTLKGIKMKVGVNVGSVFVGPVGIETRRGYTVMGDAVNLSARLAAYSDQNTVTVTKGIFDKTSSLFEYEFLGEKTYKGKGEKIASYKLIKKRKMKKASLTRWVSESAKIVGRDREMETIREKIHLVNKSKGQIIGISGEAGIGKSRLTYEIIKELKKENFMVFKGDCMSYGSAFSYHPWVEILNEFFNILPLDAIDIRKKKIKDKVLSVDKKLVEWLPVIGEIMGVPFPETQLSKFLDAKLRKQRVFDMIFGFMKYVANTNPICIVIEDLHWADTASIELINYIGRNIKDIPILLLLVYRPIDRKEEFMEKAYTTNLLLKELSEEKSLELIKNLLNITNIKKELTDLILKKSEGNPFYIEELVKSLIEQGYIVEEKGEWKFTADIRELALPDTVEAVILSRIDMLDLPERDVLQVASVLGREFDEFLIKGIYPDEKILSHALTDLRHFDLIKEEKTREHIHYIFKHVMTQEVAYDTLSYARKRELHQKAGKYIKDELKERREEFLGLLSYHFYKGGDYEKSLFYSVQAGEKAKNVYDNYSAIEFFTRAIESYEKLEEAAVDA